MKILFLNGSPNPNGNTADLAKVLLKGKDYETLNLVDYQINVYGQNIPGDQFEEVLAKVSQLMFWSSVLPFTGTTSAALSEPSLTDATVRLNQVLSLENCSSCIRGHHLKSG